MADMKTWKRTLDRELSYEEALKAYKELERSGFCNIMEEFAESYPGVKIYNIQMFKDLARQKILKAFFEKIEELSARLDKREESDS